MRPADELASAAAVLRVLAGLLGSAPSAGLVEAVRRREWLDDWPLEHTGVCRAGLDALADSAAQGETVDDIVADYAQLMGGPGRVAVHPYESVHRSAEGLLFDAETLQVRDAYAEFGLAAPNLNRSPDDHIALECEFVATLAERAVSALDEGDEAEAARLVAGLDRFLTEHLFAWGPHFFDAIGRAARTRFYRAVGLLGVDTLVQLGAGGEA